MGGFSHPAIKRSNHKPNIGNITMAHMIMVTPIKTGVWIIVGTGSIKTIQDSTEMPKAGAAADPHASEAHPEDKSTGHDLTPPAGVAPPVPLIKSTIIFMDGEKLDVKESIGDLGKLTGAEHA